jgi:hypothetical protein
MDRLSILRVVIDALGEIRTKWRGLFKALILPALAITSVEAIQGIAPIRFPWPLVFWILSAPFYVLFAVVCHRVVILGESSLPSSIGIFWSKRETRFLGWTVVLIIVSWGLALALGVVAYVLPDSVFGMSMPLLPYVIIGVILYYFYVRLSLVFPATAVDRNTSLAGAMFLSDGNGLRIMAAVAISIIPFAALAYVVSELVGDPSGVAYFIVWELAAYALMTTTICVISVVYRSLVD